jgi:hypothetical protein
MRAKVVKILRKMAYGPEGSLKAAREYKGGWQKEKFTDKDGKKQSKWWWFSLTNTGPRALYRRLKKEYSRHGLVSKHLRDSRL